MPTTPRSDDKGYDTGRLLAEIAEALVTPNQHEAAVAIATQRLAEHPEIATRVGRLLDELAFPSCDDVQSALLDTFDDWAGTLDPSQLDSVAAEHYANCPDCQQYVADMAMILDTSEERAVVSSAVAEFVAQQIAQRIERAKVYFAGLTSSARAMRSEFADLAVARSGASNQITVKEIATDPDGKWRLRSTAFLRTPLDAQIPMYEVKLDLLEPGESTRRWRDAVWQLVVRLGDRQLATRTNPDEPGVFIIDELVAEDDLSRLEFEVSLTD